MPLTIYKSSAGSGKTFQLVFEYLCLVLKDIPTVKSTLAVTFTNKASEEMKMRILETAFQLAQGHNKPMRDLLCTRLAANSNYIQTKAKELLQVLVYRYSWISVQTIDSFFNRIVKASAKELMMPLQFDIELSRDIMKSYIMNELMQEINVNEHVRTLLGNFALGKLDDGKGWNIKQELEKIADELFNDFKLVNIDFDDYTQEYIYALIAELKRIKAEFENKITQISDEFFSFLRLHQIEIDDLYYKKSGFANWFNKIIQTEEPKNLLVGSRFKNAMEGKIYSPQGMKKFGTKHIDDFFVPFITQSYTTVTSGMIPYYSACCVLKYVYVAGLMSNMNNALKKYRSEQGVLTINDISTTIKNFISRDFGAFLYEKTGIKYQHIFIDEFQDTSNVQWNNFSGLIENSLSQQQQCIIVGDVKQSIYRWRGGNMNLLNNQVMHDLFVFENQISEKLLNTNYRSRKVIVDFNNLFFVSMGQVISNLLKNVEASPISDVYGDGNVRQQVPPLPQKEGGYVRINLCELEKKTDSDDEEDKEAAKFEDMALAKMIDDITFLLSNGYKHGDIAILANKNRDAKLITEKLKASGFNLVVTPDSNLLERSDKIQMIVSCMKYACNPADVVTLELIKSIGAKTNFNTNESITALLSEASLWSNFSAIDFALTSMIRLGYQTTPDAFVSRFVDLLFDLKSKRILSIRKFLDWWEAYKSTEQCNVPVPKNEDAFTIMTIHKSKGLQFPVVLIPLANWKIDSPKTNLWVTSTEAPYHRHYFPVNVSSKLEHTYFSEAYSEERDAEKMDNLNKLYVAFTRAETVLIVTIRVNLLKVRESKYSSTTCSDLILQALSNMFALQDQIQPFIEVGKIPSPESVNKQVSLLLLDYAEIHSELPQLSDNAERNIRLEKSAYFKGIEFGRMVHELLATIRHKGEATLAVAKLKAKYDLPKEETNKLLEIALQVTVMPALQEFFNPENYILTEHEMIYNEKTLRPDRIIIRNNELQILDYKTGTQSEEHLAQVGEYTEACRQMGYEVTRTALFYTDTLQVIE